MMTFSSLLYILGLVSWTPRALIVPRSGHKTRAAAASISGVSSNLLQAPPPIDVPAATLEQRVLQISLGSDGGGKSAVQRDACAGIVRAFRGDAGGASGGEGGIANAGGSKAGAAASRATAVLPSGAGKTVLALRVVEEMRPGLTVVLVPSIDLVSQSYRDWRRWRAAPGALDGWQPLAVCSSSSVPKSELPRTTDAATIAAFLEGAAAGGGMRVVFSTYHSAARVSEAMAMAGVASADLLICDEAHKTTGPATKRDAKPLSDAFMPATKRLFLTATPRLIGEKRDKEGALILAGSMDDTSLYGEVVYRLGYAQAVARGVVCPLKLIFMNVTAEYAALVGDRLAIDDEVDAPRDLMELCLCMLDCRKEYGVRTAFAFCASNRRAADLKRVAERLLVPRGFAVGRVDGTMTAGARREVLAPLQVESDDTWLVSNCRVLGEGIDVPAVDLVAFADRKTSHTDILQCAAALECLMLVTLGSHAVCRAQVHGAGVAAGSRQGAWPCARADG